MGSYHEKRFNYFTNILDTTVMIDTTVKMTTATKINGDTKTNQAESVDIGWILKALVVSMTARIIFGE